MLDLVNSCFVLLAVAFAVADVRQILVDKRLQGVQLGTAGLMTIWPLWDLVYYHSLGQWLSLAACAVLVLARATWLVLGIRYRAATE